MASRFWVGGTGTWDASTTTHWSATSGGAGGASVPSTSDAVFLDGNSGTGTVTLSTAGLCASFDATGYTGTFDTTTAQAIRPTGATANVTLGAGMTVTNLNIDLTNASTVCTLTSNGKTVRQLQIGSSGGANSATCTLADALNSSNNVLLNAGTFNSNAQTVNALGISSSNTATRTLTITNSTLNLSGSNPWITSTTTGLTVNATGSTVNVTNNFPNPQWGNVTLNDINITALQAGTPAGSQSGQLTCRNMSISSANTSVVRAWFQIGNSFTVTGTLTLNGTSAANMVMLTSTTKGAPRTITAAAVSGSFACFQDLTGAGAATWTGTGWSDLGGNSGITFPASTTRYWVGNSGNWSSTTHWSTTSGGASGASVPLAQDSAIFDANSFSANTQTVTMDVFNVGSIDYSAVTKTGITFSLSLSLFCYGNVLGNGFQSCGFGTANTLTLAGRGSFTTGNWFGISPIPNLTVDCVTGTYTLVGHVSGSAAINTWSGTLIQNSGTLDLAGFNMNFRTYASTGTSTRALKFGTGGTITINQQTANTTVWQITGSGMTITPGTGGAIIFRQATTSGTLANTFTGGGLTYPTLRANAAGLLGGIIISDSGNSFQDIEFSDASNARTLTLPAGGTTTLRATNALTLFLGTAGKLMSLVSSTPGTTTTIALPNGPAGSNFANVQDIVATTNTLYAGANSTNGGNNTNVVFSTLLITGILMGSSSNLTVSGIQQAAAAATIASTSTLATSIAVQRTSAVSLDSTSSLTVSGQQTIPSAITLASVSTLTVTGQQTISSTVAIASTSSLTVPGRLTISSTITLASTSTLTVTGRQTISTTITLASTSTLTVTALQQVTTTVTITSTSTLTVSGTQQIPSTPTIVSTSTLSVTAVRVQLANVQMDSTSTLSVAAVLSIAAGIALDSTSALVISGQQDVPSVIVVASTSTLDTDTTSEVIGAGLIASSSALVVTGQQSIPAAIALASVSALLVSTSGTTPAAAVLASTSDLVIAPRITHAASAALASDSTLTISGILQQLAAIILTSDSTLNVTPAHEIPTGITFASLGTLMALAANVLTSGPINFDSTSTLAATGSAFPPGVYARIKGTARLNGPRGTATLNPSRWTATLEA